MKRFLLICLVGVLRARGAEALASPDRFSLIGPTYKQAHELAASLFNPFKSQSAAAALAHKESISVTDDTVLAAVARRGISGIVISGDGQTNRVVVGDEVFAAGDEVSFSDPKQAGTLPLVAGATIVLSAVRSENLEFEIRVEGEPARRLTFPLRNFWAR